MNLTAVTPSPLQTPTHPRSSAKKSEDRTSVERGRNKENPHRKTEVRSPSASTNSIATSAATSSVKAAEGKVVAEGATAVPGMASSAIVQQLLNVVGKMMEMMTVLIGKLSQPSSSTTAEECSPLSDPSRSYAVGNQDSGNNFSLLGEPATASPMSGLSSLLSQGLSFLGTKMLGFLGTGLGGGTTNVLGAVSNKITDKVGSFIAKLF